MRKIQLGEIPIEVVLKKIKNVHLSVYPPKGRVRISAPTQSKLDTLRLYAISRLGWIKRQRTKILGQERETPRSFIQRETHYFWGKRYLLDVHEGHRPQGVTLANGEMRLRVPWKASKAKRSEVLEGWRRNELRKELPEMVLRWSKKLGVSPKKVFVQKMKTQWGSCNHRTQSIRLNTELTKKPKQHLDYVVLHEMAHLLKPTHSKEFVGILNEQMPMWRETKKGLNRLPVGS